MRYLKSTFRVFMRYRYLLANLVGRDIKVKYRRSTLGLLWSVLNPLLMMTVMWLVFSTLFLRMAESEAFPLVNSTGEPPAFALYLISGQLVFAFFNDATTTAMDSVLANAQLLKKVYIPKYIFPLEKVLFALINLLFSCIALVLVFVFTASPVSAWVLLCPVVLGLLFCFNLGVGLVLSSAVVFFRDIKHLYSVLVLALTYITPVFYPENIVPEGWIRVVMRVNPMYWFVSMFRHLVVYGVAPAANQWIATAGCAAGALLLGLAVFRKTQDNFILHI